MKNRQGFTLAELMLSVMIFSFIAASLTTIYATANRHMFQNYRSNVIKTGVLVSMRAIQNNLSIATRIDSPALADKSEVLAFARNVDQLTGCYPIIVGVPVSWHYFCLADDPVIPDTRSLYYHTGLLGAGKVVGGVVVGCEHPEAEIWNAAYNVPDCGEASAGQTVTLMMQHVLPSLTTNTVFSRADSEGITENDTVRISLRSQWNAAERGFSRSQRDVDFMLDTVIKVNCSREVARPVI